MNSRKKENSYAVDALEGYKVKKFGLNAGGREEDEEERVRLGREI